jgi:hypothetical protein
VAGEAHIGFCWGNLKEIDNLENLDIDDRVTVKLIFKKSHRGVDW